MKHSGMQHLNLRRQGFQAGRLAIVSSKGAYMHAWFNIFQRTRIAASCGLLGAVVPPSFNFAALAATT
jgi:hypothetical protein